MFLFPLSGVFKVGLCELHLDGVTKPFSSFKVEYLKSCLIVQLVDLLLITSISSFMSRAPCLIRVMGFGPAQAALKGCMLGAHSGPR